MVNEGTSAASPAGYATPDGMIAAGEADLFLRELGSTTIPTYLATVGLVGAEAAAIGFRTFGSSDTTKTSTSTT